MKVWIASDHAGFTKKEMLKKYLLEKRYDVTDCGTDSEVVVDYPDYAYKVGNAVVTKGGMGILICGTGIGMSIACNKIKNIRCAKVGNEEEARLSREHNDANVIALSAKLSKDELQTLVDIFLTTKFSESERHIRRINKISEYEDHYEC